MKENPQRKTKIKSFINKFHWEGIKISSEKDDWKKIIKKNNLMIALLRGKTSKHQEVFRFLNCLHSFVKQM